MSAVQPGRTHADELRLRPGVRGTQRLLAALNRLADEQGHEGHSQRFITAAAAASAR